MPASKQKRDNSSAGESSPAKLKRNEGVENLKAAFLTKATNAQLLSRLLECHKVLDQLQGPYTVDRGFMDEVLKKEYLTNPNPDTQVVTACIIADCIRLAEPNLPFADKMCSDVIRLCCTTLNRLKTGKSSYMMYARHLMERLSQAHAFVALTQRGNEVDGDLDSLFETLLFHVTADDDAMISNMAQILVDVLSGTQTITEVQLDLLVNATTASHQASNPSNYRVACAVLARKDDMLQSTASSYISGQLDDAAEELRRIDMTDGELSERKTSLKNIVIACEHMIQLSKVSINLVTQVVPAVGKYLSTDHNDLRLLVVRAFVRAFTLVPNFISSYTNVYHTFLGRFSDPRQLIRQEMIKFSASLLKQNVDNEQVWAIMTPALTNRLLDSDEGIRKSCVECISDVAADAPRRVPRRLLEEVGRRCLDKKVPVRQLAIDKLSGLYRIDPTHFDWIPDAIFKLGYGDVGISAVEFALDVMLPMESAKQKQQASRHLAEMPVFDFEKDAAGAASLAQDGSFITCFVSLCGHLNKQNRTVLGDLMYKKAQLRATVKKLFELRNELQEKRATLSIEERDDIANKIRRLLVFLQSITHAQKDEWHVIFKDLRDERCVRSIISLCSPDCTDFAAATADVLSKLQGRAKAEVTKFFKNNLLPRLSLPFSADHVKEVVNMIDAHRVGKKDVTVLANLLRALTALGKMAPQFLPVHAGKLVKWIKEDADLYSNSTDSNAGAVTQATLEVLSLIDNATEGDEIPKPIADHSKEMITTIGRICLQNSNGKIAKGAAHCLTTVYRNSSNAFRQLLSSILEKLGTTSKQNPLQFPPQLISWLKTVTVLARNVPKQLDQFGETCFEVLSAVFLAAVRATNGAEFDTHDAKSKKLPAPLLEVPSFLAEVTDASAKALVAFVKSLPGARSMNSEAYSVLIEGFKATKGLGCGTVGACLKRLAIDKQLVKLLLTPSDMKNELTAGIFISCEDNLEVRSAVQRKMLHHFTTKHPQPDIRYLSFLLLTAISEESRASFAVLKGHVHIIGEKLRAQQQSSGASLSEAKGLACYMEYTIPFLVLYMAHSVIYEQESQTSFLAFQRVWHLLFDELFKVNTNCASFVMEMFRKLKGHDDSLAPDSNRTRVLCDLGSKVMLEILSQRSVDRDTVKAFPGNTMLPRFFAQPAQPGRFPIDRVYLDPTVVVHAHPPFKAGAMPSATPARSVARPAGGEGAYGVEQYLEGVTPMSTRKNLGFGGLSEGAAKASGGLRSSNLLGEGDDDENELESNINQAVEEITSGLSADEIGSLSWKAVKAQIESVIGQKLGKDATATAHEAIKSAYAAASK